MINNINKMIKNIIIIYITNMLKVTIIIQLLNERKKMT